MTYNYKYRFNKYNTAHNVTWYNSTTGKDSTSHRDGYYHEKKTDIIESSQIKIVSTSYQDIAYVIVIITGYPLGGVAMKLLRDEKNKKKDIIKAFPDG
jgi:hypothetical protein